MSNNFTITVHDVDTTLRSVIEKLIDGQEGFQKIGETLKDDTLKRYFLAESLKRAGFRGELEEVLHREGIRDIKEKGTSSGAVHRAWAKLKSNLGAGDHSMLVTAEEGEDELKAAYQTALDKELPFPVRQLLTSQFAHVQTVHDYVKAARDRSAS